MIRIRRAEEADLPEVIRLQHQLGPNEPPMSLDDAAAVFVLMQSYPDNVVYVAELDGAIVGTFTLLVMDKLGHNGKPAGIVEDVVVDEPQRGTGIGGEMMRFAMDHCRERGCYKLALSSNALRTGAHAFYERLGFKKHGLSFLIDL